MNNTISPKYQMKLIKEVIEAIKGEYKTNEDVRFYIEKWHQVSYDSWNNKEENFSIEYDFFSREFDLSSTLNKVEGEIILKMAIDLGLDTPDYIPCIPIFRNELKSNYQTASSTFEKALKQIETHPDIAIGLANSALESIIKEILKDERITTKPRDGKTLYDLTSDLLKEFKLFPNSDLPVEIKLIGSSLLSINQSIEKIRSTKTGFHGKTKEDYIVEDSLYTYFIINSVATVGLFLKSYYENKFPVVKLDDNSSLEEIPF